MKTEIVFKGKAFNPSTLVAIEESKFNIGFQECFLTIEWKLFELSSYKNTMQSNLAKKDLKKRKFYIRKMCLR